MARNFLPYPFAPYNGAYSSKAFNLANGAPKGLMVGLDIAWASYLANGQPLGNSNPNFVVASNLNAAGPNSVSQTWIIQSVYIDNEAVDFPVYIYFPDTFFTVSCPANSAGWYQVFTNARQALIAGVGISSAAIVGAQRTRVFFTDTGMVPSLDQEIQSAAMLGLSSPVLNNAFLNQGRYGTFALGDQISTADIALGSGNHKPVPFSGALRFVYVTQIQVQLANLTNNGATALGNISFTDNNNDRAIATANYAGGYNNLDVGSRIILDLHGQIKLDGTHTFELRNTANVNVVTGSQFWIFTYTTADI